jgi:hypothetical protein
MIERNRIPSMSPCACADSELAAALALQQDARLSRQMAREARKDEQRDRIEHMRQAAAKLREMASSAVASAIWQGVAGLAGTACSAAAAVQVHQAAPLQSVEAANKKLSAGLTEVGARLCDLAGRVEPFGLQSQRHAADKQELEVQAESAAQRAQEQGDFESEAGRFEQAAAQILQKTGDALHAARMAALR